MGRETKYTTKKAYGRPVARGGAKGGCSPSHRAEGAKKIPVFCYFLAKKYLKNAKNGHFLHSSPPHRIFLRASPPHRQILATALHACFSLNFKKIMLKLGIRLRKLNFRCKTSKNAKTRHPAPESNF